MVERALACSFRRTQTHFLTTIASTAIWATAIPLFAAPQIARFDPLALAPGKTVELTLYGQSLQDARRLWTTFTARCEFLAPADESSKKGEKLLCRVTVPRDAQVGIGAMRLVTGEGVSNPVLVMLDDLPTVTEPSDNHTTELAQSIEWPAAVDGQCDPVQEDFFQFHAAAGQRLSLEVVSQRLGSKLDSLLRLLSADGQEIVQIDDAAGGGGDSRLTHTFAAEGDYLLALRDVRYAGGGDFRYRLRVGTFPLITAAYPAGGRSGEVISFELNDDAWDAAEPLHVALPVVAGSARLFSFGVPSAGDAGSGWFQAEVNPGSESLELEPNDSVTNATEARFPGAFNGRFDKPGDHDHFKFHAKKGQRVHCVAKTRQLGSPCDLYMSLHKADGSQLEVARQGMQTTLNAEIPEDGDYVLHVEDLLTPLPVPVRDRERGDPGTRDRDEGFEIASGHVYRVDTTETYSGFSLSTEHAQYTAPQGGTVVIKVLAQRRGYNGPIELAVEGLGDGAMLEGNTLDGGETLLKLTLPESIRQGELRHAKLVGKAKVGDEIVSVSANQRELLRTVFPNVTSLPTELENSIAIGIGPPFPPFFELSLTNTTLYFPQLVGAASFDIHIGRKNDAFKDPISLKVEGLPSGVTAEVAPVEDGSKALRVSLKGPADLSEQDVPLRIAGAGKFQEQTQSVVLENIRLRVTKPLVASITLPAPIVAGGQQEATIHLQRFGDTPQPVQLHVSKAPAGLLAPISITVPTEANEVKIPLAAAATATPGKYDNLIVTASTTVEGQSVTVESEPATVEIRPPSAGRTDRQKEMR
jgi:hypothetical protein